MKRHRQLGRRKRDARRIVLAERRAFLLVAAAANLPFLALDFLEPAAHPWAVRAGRVALSASLAAMALLLSPRRAPAAVRAVVRAGAVAASIAVGLMAWGSGLLGAYLYALTWLPLAFAVALPEDPPASLLAGGTSAAAGLGTLAGLGAGPGTLLLWALAFTASTLFAAVGAAMHRRGRLVRSPAAEPAAREAAPASDARRQDADRLALVGRLATGTVHEINNLLSLVYTSLSELKEVVEAADTSSPETQARALVDEARDGLNRIRQSVTNLRTVSSSAKEDGRPGDVATAVAEALRLVAGQLRPIASVEQALADPMPPVRMGPRRLLLLVVNALVDVADALEERRAASPAPALSVPLIRVAARLVDGSVELSFDAIPGGADPSGPAAPDAERRDFFLGAYRDYLEKAGGSARTEPLAGGGSRLVLRLPLAEAPEEAEQAAAS